MNNGFGRTSQEIYFMSAPSADLAAVLERLARLERQNRVLKCLGLALICLTGLGILLAADKPAGPGTVLTANKLVLQDSNGKPRIVLTTHKDQSGIVFFTSDGQQRAFLVAEPSGVALRFMRPDGLYTSGVCCERGGVGLMGITDAGRNQTEVNAIIVPGKILLKDYTFPVSAMEKK